MLTLRGKALSSEQKKKVMQKKETENPLFLKTLLKVTLERGWIMYLIRALGRYVFHSFNPKLKQYTLPTLLREM